MSGDGASEGDLPVQAVLDMRQKDYDNNQIIQALQDQGYSSSQIFDALNKADLQEIDDDKGGRDPGGSVDESLDAAASGSSARQTAKASHAEGSSSEEEIIEEIIEEKWHDLMDKLQVVVDWKERSERRLQELESKADELDRSLERLQKSMGDRFEDYDETMKDVQSDVKAMEDTFSDALPAFTENVSKMQSLLEEMRQERPRQRQPSTGDGDSADGQGYETVSGSED